VKKISLNALNTLKLLIELNQIHIVNVEIADRIQNQIGMKIKFTLQTSKLLIEIKNQIHNVNNVEIADRNQSNSH